MILLYRPIITKEVGRFCRNILNMITVYPDRRAELRLNPLFHGFRASAVRRA